MKNKLIIGMTIILLAIIGVGVYINQQNLGSAEAALTIKEKGVTQASFRIDQLEKLGGEEFTVQLKSKGKEPVALTYTGVSLKKLLEKAGVQFTGVEVAVKAEDGYVVVFSEDDLLQEDHLYVVYAEKGLTLEGKEQGGSGPLMVVPRKDEFGQRWCKFVVEIEVR